MIPSSWIDARFFSNELLLFEMRRDAVCNRKVCVATPPPSLQTPLVRFVIFYTFRFTLQHVILKLQGFVAKVDRA